MQLKVLKQIHISSVSPDVLAGGTSIDVSDDLGAQLIKRHPDRFEQVGEPRAKRAAKPNNKRAAKSNNKAARKSGAKATSPSVEPAPAPIANATLPLAALGEPTPPAQGGNQG